MKKVLSVIMAGTMLAGLLSGCASNKDTKAGDGTEVPELLYYTIGDKQSDLPSVLEKVNVLTEEKIGAKLNIQFIDPGAYTERMQLNMASSDTFDMCFTGYVNSFTTAVERGGLLPLDKYLESTPALKESIPDWAWQASKGTDGQIYAVPNMQIMAFGLHAYTFKDLADKYQFDFNSVKTVDDLTPYLEKLKANEAGIYPAQYAFLEDAFAVDADRETMVSSLLSVTYDEEGRATIVPKIKTEYYKRDLQRTRDWYKKGYLRADLASVLDDSQDYNMGKYGVWFHNNTPGNLERLTEKFGREVIAVQLDDYYIPAGSPNATMTAIGRKSRYPEKAIQMIELLDTDKEVFNLVAFGIEDKHYKKIDDLHVSYIDGSGYAPKMDWAYGNQFNAFLLEGQDDDTWEQTEKLNNEATPSKQMGFIVDTKSISGEVSQCQSVVSEYNAALKGTMDLDVYYDELVKKLDSAGIEKIAEEVQRQFDEWYKSQH